MIIYITRHGQPATSNDIFYTPGDPVLSELGREQAKRLGKYLKEIGFEGSVYSSPYRRTAETADIIALQIESHFYLEPQLREWTVEGIEEFQGCDLKMLAADYKRLAADAFLPNPWWTLKYEDLDKVLQRVIPFLNDIIANQNKDILLVGHGASVDSCIRYFLEHDYRDELRRRGPDWNCFLCAIKVKPTIKPLYLCKTDHLLAEQITSNLITPKDLPVISD